MIKKLHVYLLPSIIELIVIFFLSFHLKYPMESGYLLWQHIILGKMDIKTGHIITENPFSYLPSTPLKRSSWLSDDIFYLLYSLGGYQILIALKVLILIVLFVMPFYLFKPSSITFAGVLPIYIILVLPGTSLRPGLFALLFWLFFIYSLYREKLILMCVTVFVWSFFHGTYIIGTLFTILFMIFNSEKLRRKGIFGVWPIVLSVMPLLFPHSSVTMFRRLQGQTFLLKGFEEWLPIKFTSFLGVVFTLYTLLWVYSAIKKRRLSCVAYGGIVLLFALRFRRFIPFFAIAGLPLILSLRFDFFKRMEVFLSKYMQVPVWLISFYVYFVFHIPNFDTYFKKDYHPYRCVHLMENLGKGDRILTLQAWVPYLYFALRGKYLFSIDGTLTQERMFIKAYMEFLKFKGDCHKTLELLGPNYVILPSVFREKMGKFCKGCLKIEHISPDCVIWKNGCVKRGKIP